jgi:hypothetical protein
MSWSAAMVGSLVAAFERPAWWVLALASFLVRGGLLLFVLPIVILPTPAGLATAFGTEITGFAFGAPSGAFIATMAVISLTVTAWLIAGGLLAAWSDVTLIAMVAASRRLELAVTGWPGRIWSVLFVRLVSHIPLAIALSWAATEVVAATWSELKSPGDLAIPLFVRIALRVPEAIALVGGAWLIGETAGGLAVRHLVIDRSSAVHALARGWRDLLRPSVVGTGLLAAGVLVAVVLPLARSAGAAWDRLRIVLIAGDDANAIFLGLVTFSAVWLGGVAAVGVVAAWRSVAWTYEVARRGHVALDRVPEAAPRPVLPGVGPGAALPEDGLSATALVPDADATTVELPESAIPVLEAVVPRPPALGLPSGSAGARHASDGEAV